MEKQGPIHKQCSYGHPAHGCASIGQPAKTYISSVKIQDETQKQWMIGMHGKRSSGKSVLSMPLDNDVLYIDRLSIIWKSDLTDKMKRSFFQAAVVSILLYGCTTWTLTKRLEKKLDGNYTRMLRAVLNKSWRQHPTRHQLYGHLPPITKTIQVR